MNMIKIMDTIEFCGFLGSFSYWDVLFSQTLGPLLVESKWESSFNRDICYKNPFIGICTGAALWFEEKCLVEKNTKNRSSTFEFYSKIAFFPLLNCFFHSFHNLVRLPYWYISTDCLSSHVSTLDLPRWFELRWENTVCSHVPNPWIIGADYRRVAMRVRTARLCSHV